MKGSQEQKLETRKKIINTAADLFVEQGFESTSMKTDRSKSRCW